MLPLVIYSMVIFEFTYYDIVTYTIINTVEKRKKYNYGKLQVLVL